MNAGDLPRVATLEYTEPLVKATVAVFWRRTVGIGYLVALALLFGAFAFLALQGDRSWLVGGLGAIAILGAGFALALYIVHLRGTLARFRGMGTPTATLALGDDSFTLTSGLGSTSLPWSSVTEVWRYPSFWLLLFSKAQFVTLPLAAVSPEAQAFIASRVVAAGGRIVD